MFIKILGWETIRGFFMTDEEWDSVFCGVERGFGKLTEMRFVGS